MKRILHQIECRSNRALSFPEEPILKKESKTVIWSADFELLPAVFKMYRYRGPHTVARCAAAGFRVEREYRALRRLSRWNVPCPDPLAWSWGWRREHGFYETLVTNRIEGVIDLEAALKTVSSLPLARLFSCVRKMHECGLAHQMLRLRNIVACSQGSEPHFYLMDFARSRFFPSSIVGTRMARYDLVDLVFDLLRAGVPPQSMGWHAYGLDQAGADNLWTAVREYREGKWERAWRDAELRLRSASATAFFPKRRRRSVLFERIRQWQSARG